MDECDCRTKDEQHVEWRDDHGVSNDGHAADCPVNPQKLARGQRDTAPEPEPTAEAGEIKQTAPIFPWEILFRNSVTFFQEKPSGGMILKFCPLARTPIGNQPIPPGLVIDFNASGWEHFQKEVAAGTNLERVEIATALPPGVRLDG